MLEKEDFARKIGIFQYAENFSNVLVFLHARKFTNFPHVKNPRIFKHKLFS